MLLGVQRPPIPSASPPVRETGRYALAADAETRWVPFELTPANQIRFTMSVDGLAVSAILDTGVSYSVLRRGTPGIDQRRVRPIGEAAAIGGMVPVGWVETRTVSLGSVTRTGGGLAVAELPALATGSATPVDLLVGRDLLERYALDVDFVAKRFRLLPSGRMPFRGQVAPLAVSPTRRVYESEVLLGGRRVRPMVVDLGDGSAVTVARAEWNAAALRAQPMTSTVSFGLGGKVVADLAIVPVLRVGGVSARDVEIRIEEAHGFSRRIGVAGRIGSGFLGRYRVLLDPGAGRMVLSPAPGAEERPIRSTSGLLLGVLPDRLRVFHAMRNGPGAAAGWKDGDMICAVDGQSIGQSYPASPLARWTVGEPGRVVHLRDCAGTERPVTLARFY